jgi:hypothetical protein
MGWSTGIRFPAEAAIFFSSPPRPDRLWVPPSLLSNAYPRVKRSRHEAYHSHLAPKLIMRGAMPSLLHPPSGHDALLSTGRTSPLTYIPLRCIGHADRIETVWNFEMFMCFQWFVKLWWMTPVIGHLHLASRLTLHRSKVRQICPCA